MTRPLFTYPRDFKINTLKPDSQGRVILEVSSGGTPSTKINEYWGGNIPWLTPKEVCASKDKTFFSSTQRFITEKGLKNSGAKLLEPGTVMLTKRAPVGEVAVSAVKMATNQGFLNFKCGPDLEPLYLYYWLKVNKPYLHVVANGSTYSELYVGDLFELKIGYPPIDEQKRIIELILSIKQTISLGYTLESNMFDSKMIDVLHKDTFYLRKFENKLMINLISGKLRINDLVKNNWLAMESKSATNLNVD